MSAVAVVRALFEESNDKSRDTSMTGLLAAAPTRAHRAACYAQLAKAERDFSPSVSWFHALDACKVLDLDPGILGPRMLRRPWLEALFAHVVAEHERPSVSRSQPALVGEPAIDPTLAKFEQLVDALFDVRLRFRDGAANDEDLIAATDAVKAAFLLGPYAPDAGFWGRAASRLTAERDRLKGQLRAALEKLNDPRIKAFLAVSPEIRTELVRDLPVIADQAAIGATDPMTIAETEALKLAAAALEALGEGK